MNNNMFNLAMHCLFMVSMLGCFYAVSASAAPMDRHFEVVIDKSRFIKVKQNINQVTVANPEVADIQLLDEHNLYILGRKLGTTNVTVADSSRNFFMTLDVEVTHDINGLKTKLHELIPTENPSIHSSQGSIVITGQVTSAEKMDAIMAIANTFLHQEDKASSAGQSEGGPVAGHQNLSEKNRNPSVINMMQVGGPQQVMLEVKVAEVDRTLSKHLKIDFNALKSGGNLQGGAISGSASISALTDLVNVMPSVVTPFGLFGRFIGSNNSENIVINAARKNGLVKILAEPTLTTISGQTADFLSGGEFPIPVQQNAANGIGSITINYKEYGVATKFLPVVLDSGRISLKLSIDVSELNDINTVVASVTNTQNSFTIKGLTKRRADSTVELADGQTIGIAGLISDNVHESINKFPGLADIPILGQLFTSQEFIKDQTELVIFVTPRLVKPMPNATPKLPTDHFVEPNDIEFYLLGRTESLQRPLNSEKAVGGSVGLIGQFGQALH